MWSLHVSRQDSSQLLARVTNTILEARAPSTRRLYALKWSVFSDWYLARNQDPVSRDMSHVLTFLQELLDKGRTPSTLKVYVVVIAANHCLEAGRIARNDLVIQFLRGTRWLNPLRPKTELVYSPESSQELPL